MSNQTISLANIDLWVQDKIQNATDTPADQTTRVRAYNDVIQFLQSAGNWNPTKRVNTFSYLNLESDYSIANNLSINDYKAPYQIRDPNLIYERFDNIDEKLMSEYIAESRLINSYTVEERDNDNILRVIYRNGNTITNITPMDSLTDNGSWSATGDAGSLAVDTTRFKKGSASFKFNITASGGFAGVSNTTLTAIDLTSYKNIAHFRVWLDLQQWTATQLGYITNVELRWGTDASNYYKQTQANSITGGTFKANWNKVDFDWSTATTVGSPTITNIKYFELRINYSASMTNVNNTRFDNLDAILPTDLEFVYFSNYFVSKTGVLQEEFTTSTVDTTELLLIPTRHRTFFTDTAAQYLFKIIKNPETSQAYLYDQVKSSDGFKKMFKDIGNPIVREVRAALPRGFSNGRQVERQW